MSIARHHAEWLSLVEQSGPFLSMPVLMRVFPQGLEAHDPERFRLLRQAYEEWEDNNQAGRRTNPVIHANWIRFILRTILQLPDNCIAEGQAIPQPLQVNVAEHGELLRPNIVIKNPDGGPDGGKPRLLIQTYHGSQDLSKPIHGSAWKASPDTRMMELLHGTGVRLGLVTNGEQWMLVDAPRNETTGFASWYAHLWLEEQITLRAFTSLLNANRFFAVPDPDAVEGMLAESASNQQEVTDQLGYQVRKAVEVLVQSLDRADQDHGRQLLEGIPETEVYEAALTVMMRLVFLFCAEERGLLLLGDAVYDENYAVSTMQEQLHEAADQHGEEILERRHDAWCRLLSTFRGVFGGIEHERLTLPPYGGKLFDPDRFPFLEGRKHGTTWRTCEAEPLPINNRTVLHLLDALQLLQVKLPGGGPAEARRLSFRALDIEQIGHVYEGLLDHTAKRATEPVLGLTGAKDREPELPLSELEALKAKGQDALVAFLVEETGRSEKALRKVQQTELDLHETSRLQGVCGGDAGLLQRLTPFAGLIRDDTFGYPVVIPKGSVYVTAGTARRSSGTHYTPRILTEPLAQYTLEPLVYVGPAEGTPKEQWKLRSAGELLDLKICDMACGSGSILLQAGRYMSERLLEAWELAEKSLPKGTPGITPEGAPSTGKPGETLIPKDPDERIAYARRLVAQRCLYGVDINPLAVEMAKLSLWLWTLAKDKPFTFLDHAIRCGDSLLGIHDLKQLKTFSLDGTGQQYVFGEEPMDDLVDKAIELRLKIESMPSGNIEDIEVQARLMADCEQRVEFLNCAADMLIAAEMKGDNPREKLEKRDDAAVQIGHYLKAGKPGEFRAAATKALGRRRFHWPLEFPEIVVKRGRFDAFVGNPPFMGGLKLAEAFGRSYRPYLVACLAKGRTQTADLCAYFFLRGASLLKAGGHLGLLATKTIAQGDTRAVGLAEIIQAGGTIHRAIASRRWPGAANVEIAVVWLRHGTWLGDFVLDEQVVTAITAALAEGTEAFSAPVALAVNDKLAFQGSNMLGLGFTLTPEDAGSLLVSNPKNRDVIFPYLTGEDLNTHPQQQPSRHVIYFRGWPLSRASAPNEYVGPVAADYPECLSIVEQKVRPERAKNNDPRRRDIWWQFTRPTTDIYDIAARMKRILVVAQVSRTAAFIFVPTGWVFSHKVIVFAFDDDAHFAVLQSSFHIDWAWRFSGTLKSDLSYSPRDCFAAWPFPDLNSHNVARKLALAGDAYHGDRAEAMVRGGLGLTYLYKQFHDPAVKATDIQKLRDLHIEMDKAVAAAYGWDDLKLGHDFHQTKQGLRFTISEPARREVLARLLKLNHERYAEEVAQGLHDKKKGRAATAGRRTTAEPAAPRELTLFNLMTYPSTDTDKAVCAAFLAVVEQAGSLESTASLTALLLATHPQWCKVFLKPADRKRLDSAVQRATATLVVGDGVSIRWKDARDHLELRKAIKIDRGSPEQPITSTPELPAVKATFPGPVDEIIALALAAASSIGKLRTGITTATQEQKRLLAVFQTEAIAVGLGAA